jgi:hypothetical protein
MGCTGLWPGSNALSLLKKGLTCRYVIFEMNCAGFSSPGLIKLTASSSHSIDAVISESLPLPKADQLQILPCTLAASELYLLGFQTVDTNRANMV